MFQFSCRFAFLSTFRLSNRTPIIMQILTLYQANAATLMLFSKWDKILIKNLYECKGYNTWQFITKFMNKGWTKNSISRLLVKFGTVDQRPGSGRRSARTDDNVDTVESLLLSQEDKPQSHWTVREISREAGNQSIICFADYSQSSSATRKGALNSWLKRTACTRYFRYAVRETRDNNTIISKPTWK